jgi:hypothetical protein
MLRLIVLGLTLFTLACTTAPTPPPASTTSANLSAFSVISVTDPEFSPSRGETVSWVSDVIFVGREETASDQQAVDVIKADIGADMQQKGYRLAEGMNVDYRVVALVQVGDEQLSEDMRELFRLYPSLGRDSQQGKGMLIVAVARPGSVEALWRGAIKVFLDDEGLLTTEQSRQRLRHAVGKVMASLPKAR